MASQSHFPEGVELMAKNRLILLISQDPNSNDSVSYRVKAKKSLFLGLFSRKLLFVVTGLAFVLSPMLARASLFSFVVGLFGSAEAKSNTELTVGNSQNMSLLQAALNPDPNPSKGGGEITIVGGTALLPESGPTGTLADVAGRVSSDQISIYVVHKGDSISQIAKMFGVSVNTIIWGNDLKSSIISEGQVLVILPVSGVRHLVVKGDTLQSIAKKYKGDLKEIMQFNSIASADAVLSPGDEVIIPDGEVAPQFSNYVTNTPRGTNGPNYEGYYMRPIIGGRKTQGLHGYNGIDLGAPLGTPVFAAAGGDVIISRNYGWNGGYGNYIAISHPNGTQTLYAHLNEVVMYEGARVAQGQLIGYVGTTGKSTGPHLHFEVRGARNPF